MIILYVADGVRGDNDASFYNNTLFPPKLALNKTIKEPHQPQHHQSLLLLLILLLLLLLLLLIVLLFSLDLLIPPTHQRLITTFLRFLLLRNPHTDVETIKLSSFNPQTEQQIVLKLHGEEIQEGTSQVIIVFSADEQNFLPKCGSIQASGSLLLLLLLPPVDK